MVARSGCVRKEQIFSLPSKTQKHVSDIYKDRAPKSLPIYISYQAGVSDAEQCKKLLLLQQLKAHCFHTSLIICVTADHKPSEILFLPLLLELSPPVLVKPGFHGGILVRKGV